MTQDANDPLARFKQIQRHGKDADPAGLDAAHLPVAFGVDSKSHDRLRINTFQGINYAPSYRYLMDVMSNEAGTQINLAFSFLMVRIRGRNLQLLARALEEGTCVFIREFHPDTSRFSPTDPIIEEIFVKVRQDDDMAFE
jgi:hypothetical protein